MTADQPRRRRRTLRPERQHLVIVAGLAASMAGCSPHDDGQWRVCSDAQGRRLPDVACQQSNSGGYHGGGGTWVFINQSSSAPAVGQPVQGAARSASGPVSFAPEEGISRGGFGSSAGEGHGAGE